MDAPDEGTSPMRIFNGYLPGTGQIHVEWQDQTLPSMRFLCHICGDSYATIRSFNNHQLSKWIFITGCCWHCHSATRQPGSLKVEYQPTFGPWKAINPSTLPRELLQWQLESDKKWNLNQPPLNSPESTAS